MVKLSVLKLSGTKKERVKFKVFEKYIKVKFNSLKQMLNKDYIYSPFNYLGYYNLYNNICSNANLIVIDVDTTDINIYDRCKLMQDEEILAILATTSDKTNVYKYRILIKLNVEVTKEEYRRLVKGIKINGLIPDMDTTSYKPSQMFFSYQDSIVLSTSNSKELNVKDYILPVSEDSVSEMSGEEVELNFHIEFNTYKYARPGNRNKSLLSAGFKMKELGYSYSQIVKYINILNSSLLHPVDNNSLKRRVFKFLKGDK